MINVLVPLAAPEDGYFPEREFHFPKPLIEIAGRPMIERVIENLSTLGEELRFIFIVRSEDCRRFSLDNVLTIASHGRCDIIRLERPTHGAICSALMAVELIDNDTPLVIANGDQIFDGGLAHVIGQFDARAADVGLVTFDAIHPRWSYVRATGDSVSEAAEKRPISRDAIAGLYYYRRGAEFVEYAMAAMRAGSEHNGAFYTSATINQAILAGKSVTKTAFPEARYHSFFSPQRLELYERTVGENASMNSANRSPLFVIPMAGMGSRFANAGYDKPKPFIDVAGRPMIERVMDNLHVPGASYLLLARQEHLDAEPEIVAALKARGDVRFQAVDKLTEGAACTVLLAREAIDVDRPIIIANCDQIVDFDSAAWVADAQTRKLDGSILCFRDPTMDPKWSFAKLRPDGMVSEVKEKVAISDLATVGLYYFSSGKRFIDAAVDMIVRNDRVNNEFYVCPVYNYQVASGARVGVFEIDQTAMHGIGTPEDLNTFLALRYP